MMCGSAETQVLMMFTMQIINICGVVYVGSKVFGFIRIVAKYLLREMERNELCTDCDKKEKM